MTDHAVVLQKLTTLQEHLGRVRRRRRPATLDAFRQDIDLQNAVALSLLVAIHDGGPAAATAVGMTLGRDRPPPIFRAVHPFLFLFLIRHTPTDAILFVGRIVDPTA